MYTAFLEIFGVFYLDLFEQPVKNEFFYILLNISFKNEEIGPFEERAL
jgi:hypothetical protein